MCLLCIIPRMKKHLSLAQELGIVPGKMQADPQFSSVYELHCGQLAARRGSLLRKAIPKSVQLQIALAAVCATQDYLLSSTLPVYRGTSGRKESGPISVAGSKVSSPPWSTTSTAGVAAASTRVPQDIEHKFLWLDALMIYAFSFLPPTHHCSTARIHSSLRYSPGHP